MAPQHQQRNVVSKAPVAEQPPLESRARSTLKSSLTGLPIEEQLEMLQPPEPVQMRAESGTVVQRETGDGTDSLDGKSYAERLKALGDSAGQMPTYVAFTTVKPPPNPSQGQTFWDTIGNPSNWVSERASLHVSLASAAKDQAKKFEEQMKAEGKAPTIYAMRGNTASGKSRAIMSNVPELAGATDRAEPHRAINPDNFKTDLYGVTPVPVSSSQIHHESSAIAWEVKKAVMGAKREGDQKGSVLIDERLVDPGSVNGLVKEAKDSNRQLNIYDVDAPLETSLYGVLLREPGGADPIPPFAVIAKGFTDSRVNREACMAPFLSDPALGKYELIGAMPDGTRVTVATVSGGTLSVSDAVMFEELVKNPTKAPEDLQRVVDTLQNEVISDSVIARITAPLSGDFASKVAAALEKYKGKKFGETVDEASRALSRPR